MHLHLKKFIHQKLMNFWCIFINSLILLFIGKYFLLALAIGLEVSIHSLWVPLYLCVCMLTIFFITKNCNQLSAHHTKIEPPFSAPDYKTCKKRLPLFF